jgi:hypothetical protein
LKRSASISASASATGSMLWRVVSAADSAATVCDSASGSSTAIGARQYGHAASFARSIAAPQPLQRTVPTALRRRSSSGFGSGRTKLFSSRNCTNGVKRPWPRAQR